MATQQEDKLKERRERITKGLAEKRFTQTQPPIKAYAFNTERSIEGLRTSILNHLKFTLARTPIGARPRDWWLCLSYSIRDRILERLLATQESHHKNNVRRAYYFSLEYLMGRLLDNNLWNLGMHDDAVLALKEIDLDLSQIEEEEPDMGLGNGGLGRLAACFLDSLATLEYAAVGYGIYYEFGLFKQEFIDHQQVEKPDHWLQMGNPWLVVRPEYKQEIPLFGRVIDDFDDRGDYRPMWVDTKKLIGVPWDLPIVGYGARTVNYLRLWESRASEEFDLQVFNEGGYVEAVREKAIGETISKVLYPSDKTESGRELRLQQEYFFVACSLRDIIRNHFRDNTSWDSFPEKVTVQLNDTHPAISIAEFMRLLVDDERLDWDFAWDMCQKVFAYTNHTLMPEALEKWSVSVFEKILPRHLQIIYEINRRFLEHIVEAKWPGNDEKKKVLSIIEDHHGEKMVRMSYLSIVGSHSVNGVAFLHTELLKKDLFADFYALFPEKFNNKTNGITPRRWLKACNPLLSKLITKKIGDNWITNLDELRKLEQYADNEEFQKDFMTVKHTNKEYLAHIIKEECGIEVDPIAIFDVQIKRLHEYKRQHLNLLHILTLYRKLLHEPNFDMHPRVFIFAAKAAPGYEIAKEIIHAINAAGERINNDPRTKGKLKVAFIPNYSVSLAAKIIPAADVSEQISTAGREASGTGNMKLALNGAVTVGTLDGANIEILEEVGPDNIFIFGNDVEDINTLKQNGYNPWDYYHANHELQAVMDWSCSDFFTPGEHSCFGPLHRTLLEGGDPFCVLADYDSYCKIHQKVDEAYKDKKRWAKMAILNTARVGKFSSDRTIFEYAEDIWNLKPQPV